MNLNPHLPLESESEEPVRVRTLFLSDVHLGTRDCQADTLLDFLRCYDVDTIYLIGNIVDGRQLKATWYWPQSHNDVVQKLLRKARKGARVIYIPGDHDDFLRCYYGSHFGGIDVVESAVHTAADGRRYVVVHGDESNTRISAIRRPLGFVRWPLSRWARTRISSEPHLISEFERKLASEALRRGSNGVICGHIHRPAIRSHDGLTYVNCGDWVENCTAAIEQFDGRLEIVRWLAADSAQFAGRDRSII